MYSAHRYNLGFGFRVDFIFDGEGFLEFANELFFISHRLVHVALVYTPAGHGKELIVLFAAEFFVPLAGIAPYPQCVVISVSLR